jgi:hypothetical protein
MRCGGAINLRFDANSVRGEDARPRSGRLSSRTLRWEGSSSTLRVADTAVMRAAQKNPQDYQD